MTGPDHYREAERLLGMAYHFTYGGDPVTGAALAAEAQAHATLALAAATAMSGSSTGMSRIDFTAWDKAAGVPMKDGGDSRD
ncbi:hypothetical protein [Streptomyces sp. NPDC047097]|uniref:hypothetical protein n=1 Tax=Streptomyces sp. NPDC047097 TaxID=3155260 RepID=UPI0033CB38A7